MPACRIRRPAVWRGLAVGITATLLATAAAACGGGGGAAGPKAGTARSPLVVGLTDGQVRGQGGRAAPMSISASRMRRRR